MAAPMVLSVVEDPGDHLGPTEVPLLGFALEVDVAEPVILKVSIKEEVDQPYLHVR